MNLSFLDLSEHSDRLDLDSSAFGESGDLKGGTGGVVVGKVLLVDLVDINKVVNVGKQDGGVDN